VASFYESANLKITNLLTNDAVLHELGARIARLRIDHGMTQDSLAAAAGIAKRTLERLENGDQVQLVTLICVLRELGRLDAMDLVAPDVEVRPVQMLEAKAHTRKRAPRGTAAGTRDVAPGAWKWGDEK